jgi:hypothetical protein
MGFEIAISKLATNRAATGIGRLSIIRKTV